MSQTLQTASSPQPDRRMDELVASPCCFPKWPLQQVLSAAARMGFRRFEVFTDWVAARLDVDGDVDGYGASLLRHGMRASSIHLPPVRQADPKASAGRAIWGLEAGARLGAGVAIFKGETRNALIECAPRLLDRAEELGLALVIQNHRGSAISTLEDALEVLQRVDDERLRVLLEVGHLLAVGVHWRDALPRFGERVAYVHLKDLRGGEVVLYGEGDADLRGLFAAMRQRHYRGGYVVEIEGAIRDSDPEANLARCVEYVKRHCLQEQTT